MTYFIKDTTAVNIRRRTNLLLLLFFVLFGIIAFRLFSIQILDSEKYQISARKQYESKIILYPSRGLIFDRNMNLLVSNSFNVSIAADPNMVTKPDEIAQHLASRLGQPKEFYLEKLSTPNTSFVYLERKIDAQKIQGLDTLKYDGLIILKEPTRVYNYNQLASQILGLTNNENDGLSGIEKTLNDQLSGTEGFMIMKRDGKGNLRPATEFPRKEPVKGNNVVLTIDINIQRIVEEELYRTAIEHKAAGVRSVVMSVKTGEILAMSSYPTFDPSHIRPADTAGFRNAVITDQFEPGSTFKLITVAASLEERITNINSIIRTESESYGVTGSQLTNVNSPESISFQKAVEQSSNSGMIKIANVLGKEKFYKYSRDFGFGIPTGIELTGESSGTLKRPIDFLPQSLDYLAIGYQVSVTTLQMAAAYSCVANNGMYMKPYIVMKELNASGETESENKPIEIRQVVSPNTSKIISQLLTGVVQRGTGMEASLDGILVAGKTGTAQKLVDGSYSSSHHQSSFIGYFPADNPIILIAVVIDDPGSGVYYGGKISAPVFKRIATKILDYKSIDELYNPVITGRDQMKVDENLTSNEDEVFIPKLTYKTLQDAIKILNEKSFSYKVTDETGKEIKNNEGNEKMFVVLQNPSPNLKYPMNEKPEVALVVSGFENKNEEFTLPDITGLSLRNAINKLIASGFEIEINGSGAVISQYPPAGTSLFPGAKVVIYCDQNL